MEGAGDEDLTSLEAMEGARDEDLISLEADDEDFKPETRRGGNLGAAESATSRGREHGAATSTTPGREHGAIMSTGHGTMRLTLHEREHGAGHQPAMKGKMALRRLPAVEENMVLDH